MCSGQQVTDLKLCHVVICIWYWSAIDSLWWDVESTSELDYEGANTPMGPNGAHFELRYMMTWFMNVGLTLSSLLCIRAFW